MLGNILLALLSIIVTLSPVKKTQPWWQCNIDVCVLENPLKKPVKFYFDCGEEWKKFTVIIPPKTQDQVIIEKVASDRSIMCSIDNWEIVKK